MSYLLNKLYFLVRVYVEGGYCFLCSKKLLFSLLILVFLMCNVVYAGDNTTISDYSVNETVKDISSDKVVALENGHFNTSFSDGSNGYCLEYGEQEASVNDTFYKVDTSYARNSLNNQRVGNYIKLFFVEYTDYALSDSVRTQHYIWHFTDDFNGWRLNYTIIDMIKSSNRVIPDYFEEDLGNGSVRCFEFNVLLALYEHHQDYFTYKIFYRNVTDVNGTIGNVSDEENFTVPVNINVNYTVDIYENVCFKEVRSYGDEYVITTSLNKRVTGSNLFNILFILIFLIVLLISLKVLRK